MTAAQQNSGTPPYSVLAVAGARPNFMKIAPLMHAMQADPRFEPFLVHTGQHYDAAMSESFFRDLGIPEPDVNLGIGSGSHGEQTGRVLIEIEKLLIERRPHVVLVVGDVNSTLAATLAAVKLHIPVAHVEAGLRSRDREMPEEINRILTDSVSTWLFTTEAEGNENLVAEGVDEDRVHLVGNVMIDTLLRNVERAREIDAPTRLGLERGRYGLLTLHRPSNVDDPRALKALIGALEEIHRDLPIVFPVHPRTRAAFESLLDGELPNLRLEEPMGYLDFLGMMDGAKLVLTDSGGIQEETTALGVTCLTLRDSTERPITETDGTNTVVGTDPEVILKAAHEVLAGRGKAGRIPPLWDGATAERIVEILAGDLRSGA